MRILNKFDIESFIHSSFRLVAWPFPTKLVVWVGKIS